MIFFFFKLSFFNFLCFTDYQTQLFLWVCDDRSPPRIAQNRVQNKRHSGAFVLSCSSSSSPRPPSFIIDFHPLLSQRTTPQSRPRNPSSSASIAAIFASPPPTPPPIVVVGGGGKAGAPPASRHDYYFLPYVYNA